MKRFFSVIFVLFLLLCHDVGASQTKTDASDNSNTPPPVAENQNPADESPQPHQEEARKEDDRVIRDQSSALVERVKKLANKANLALLISFFATLFAFLSWRVGSGANKAAWESVKSDRAWVTFDRIAHMAIFQGKPVTINTAKIRIHWKNTGNSPALKVTCSITIKVSDTIEGACILIDALTPSELVTETHVGPNQEFFSEFIVIPPNQFLDVVSGGKVAVIFCNVRYQDIRNQDTWRTSKVWQQIVFTGGTINMSDDGVFNNLKGGSVFIRGDEIT